MDSNEHNKVIAFDTLFSTNHISMLKIMLPYMDNQIQKSFAIYIKFLELNYTIEFFKRNSAPIYSCMEKADSQDMFRLCSELLPYCNDTERKQIEQIKSIFQGMEMYREMSKTMEMMKDFMPGMDNMENFSNLFTGNTSSEQEAGGPDIMSILTNMLSPEQKEMFDLFGGNQHDE